MSDVKMNVSRGQGLIHTLQKYLREKGEQAEIKGENYEKVMKKFIELNDNRKANNKTPIFTGGQIYNGGSGRENFIVQPGDLVFTEDEVKGLFEALGLSINQPKDNSAAAKPNEKTTNPNNQSNQNSPTNINNPTNPTNPTDTKNPTNPKDKPTNSPISNQPAKKENPAAKFDRKAYDQKLAQAKTSADVVKAETDAYKEGTRLKEEVTKVDLKDLNKYGNEATWKSSVDNYFTNNKDSVLNTTVRGGEYDTDKRSVSERVSAGEKENSPTLQQEIKNKGLEKTVKEKAEIDLKNVAGLDLTKIENLKLDTTPENIEKTTQSLEDAAKEIKEGQQKIKEKTDEVKQNLAEQNKRIDTQISEIEGHKRVIEQYLKVEKDDPSLKEYNENKKEIEKTNHNNYDAYGQNKFAREAKDKEILSQYVKDIKVVNGKWDLSGINDPKQKAEAENALARLSKKYPDIETQVKNIGDACKQIEAARKEVVKGLKEIAEYEVIQRYLDNLTKDLNDKSNQLKQLNKNLKSVEDFIADAEKKVEKKHKKEQKRADKAKEAAEKKAEETSKKSDKSRAELADDNKKNPAKTTQKAIKDAEKSVKAAEKTVGKTKIYNKRQAVVNQYERAMYDLEAARNLYNTGIDPKKAPKEVKTKEDLPDELKTKYEVLQETFRGCDVTFIYQENTITVKDNQTKKNILKIDESYSENTIRMFDTTSVSCK